MRMKAPFARTVCRVCSFLVLAAAFLGTGLSSSKPAAAQEPTAGSSTGASAENQAAQAAENKEREDLDVYRHAAIVQSIGHKLGMDTETTARAFELVNFLIIFFAIVIPVVRIVPKVLRKRSETLNHDIKTAREATADASARLSAVEAKLAGLDAEIQKFRTQIEQESLEDQKRIKASFEEESARIVASAEQEITQAAAQATRGLRTFAADLAIAQAERQLVLTPEIDRAVIDEFIAGVAANGAGNGGSK